jgi:3-oxo-5alpha-steroid 4-dehydrogenase
VANIEWLEGYGVRFSGSEAPYKTSYPVGDYYLHYSGNEKAEPMASLADPVPRGHRPVGKGLAGMEMTGHALWSPIFNSAIRLGVSFKPASRVHELLIDHTGSVRGVRYRTLDNSVMCLLAARPYRWLAEIAKEYQTTLQPIATCLDYLADFIWHRVSKKNVLESNTVILAAGGFVSTYSVPLSRHTPAFGSAIYMNLQ